MTKFCEGCPERGRARGELMGLVGSTFVSRRFGRGYYGALYDENRDISKLIRVPLSSAREDSPFLENVLEKIDRCVAPPTAEVGIFRRRVIATHCPAVGGLALDPQHSLRDYHARALLPELQAMSLEAPGDEPTFVAPPEQ